MATFAALEGFAEFHGAKPAIKAPSAEKVEEMLLRMPDAPKGRRT